MALPPIEDAGELEGDADMDDTGGDDIPLEPGGELDPMFANDAQEAFPDLDDAGLMALQRAVLGLISGGSAGGMGGSGAPAAPGLGF